MSQFFPFETSNSSYYRALGGATSRTRITRASLSGLEEPSLKLLFIILVKKGHPLEVEPSIASYTGAFHRDCVLRTCRRHYSSWEVSRESQSSLLRFFVESIATDHQTWRKSPKTLFSVSCAEMNPIPEPRNHVT